MSKLNEAVAIVLKEVETWQMRLQAWHFVMEGFSFGRSETAAEAAKELLYGKLYEKLFDAYRELFMWGVVLDKDLRTKAKKMAYEQFLKEGNAIMGYLYEGPGQPRSYFDDEYDAFRKEIENAFSEGSDQ